MNAIASSNDKKCQVHQRHGVAIVLCFVADA